MTYQARTIGTERYEFISLTEREAKIEATKWNWRKTPIVLCVKTDGDFQPVARKAGRTWTKV